MNSTAYKTGRHKFAVDVSFTVEVEAESQEEAYAIVEEKVRNGELTSESEGFEQTDDYDIEVSGEEREDGEIEYR